MQFTDSIFTGLSHGTSVYYNSHMNENERRLVLVTKYFIELYRILCFDIFLWQRLNILNNCILKLKTIRSWRWPWTILYIIRFKKNILWDKLRHDDKQREDPQVWTVQVMWNENHFNNKYNWIMPMLSGEIHSSKAVNSLVMLEVCQNINSIKSFQSSGFCINCMTKDINNLGLNCAKLRSSWA